MTPSARVQGAIDLLDAIIASARTGGAAADVVATRYFKERRYAGGGDRRAIRDLTWRAIRRFGEVPETGRSAIVALADAGDISADLFDGAGHGPAPIASDEPRAAGDLVPAWLRPLLDDRLTEADYEALLERAPLDLRINRAREGRADLPEGEPLQPPLDGLRLPSDSAILETEAYRSGLVEVQDAGSQLISAACAVRPGMTVVDLCAGAGGKTLALAAAMGGQGELVACDTDRRRLQEMPPRLQRAGVDIVEGRLLNPRREWEALSDLEGACDVVLVDAPCSGTGTWRRNPEGRWRLTPERLQRLVDEQERLLDIAAKLVASDGVLVYAVCALTRCEGEGQVDAFLQRSNWKADKLMTAEGQGIQAGRPAGAGRLLTPLHDDCDGFFVARLCR